MVGLAAGMALLATFGFVDIWENGIYGSDWSEIWAGPHVFVTGGNPYDPTTWTNAIDTLGVQHAGLPVYNYPGWIPIILAPFGAMDLDPSARIWLGLTLFIGATGLFVLLDQILDRLPLAFTLFGFALIASEPGIVTFYSGQWDFLIVGLLSLMTLFLRRRRFATSGALASIMIVKPQLFLIAVPGLL
ncbi:MAG TPA: glycosyltransferase family 87 protein, partial [Candidatus Limnocylindria bacterium]